MRLHVPEFGDIWLCDASDAKEAGSWPEVILDQAPIVTIAEAKWLEQTPQEMWLAVLDVKVVFGSDSRVSQVLRPREEEPVGLIDCDD